MKTISDILKQLQTVPLSQLAKKVVHGLQRKTKAGFEAFLDKKQCSYEQSFECNQEIPSILRFPNDGSLSAHALSILALADNYCQSIFTVLDSGWVDYGIKGNDHRDRLKQTVTKANYSESLFILDTLLSSPFYAHHKKDCVQYYPINWQLDCKSGFHWSATSHYSEITYGDKPGIDVKVPWEIGRFQHAPILAFAAALSKEHEQAVHSKEYYAHTFRTQVLDFIACNPPRFGVQWKTPMDCGIRAMNILIAFDLFREIGIVWDAPFERIVRRSLHEHVIHIFHHLEWSSTNRGNHYLANLAGMMIALKGLPKSDERYAFMRFILAECAAEAKAQFGNDGCNFEASIPYHSLSSDLLAACYASFASLDENERIALCSASTHFSSKSATIQPATPAEFAKAMQTIRMTLEKAVESMIAMSTDGIHLPNIGDNDSGALWRCTPNGEWVDSHRASTLFLNVNPDYELPELLHVYPPQKTLEPYEWIPDTLDMRPTIASISAALHRDCPIISLKAGALEYQIMASIAGHRDIQSGLNAIPLTFKEDYPIKREFNDFGLWIYEDQAYKAMMRAGSIGQNGKGGHAHNDQVSLIVSAHGEEFFGDPGTFFYTSSPVMRNIGRSVVMHSTLFLPGKEQNQWVEGSGDVLFWMKGDKTKADGMFIDHLWKGGHHAFGKPHLRSLSFTPSSIRGHDKCDIPFKKIVQFHCVPGIIPQQEEGISIVLRSPLGKEISLKSLSGFSWHILPAVYSRAYGRVEESVIIRMEVDEKTTDIHWEIKITDI